jgi:hypothetical protein
MTMAQWPSEDALTAISDISARRDTRRRRADISDIGQNVRATGRVGAVAQLIYRILDIASDIQYPIYRATRTRAAGYP